MARATGEAHAGGQCYVLEPLKWGDASGGICSWLGERTYAAPAREPTPPRPPADRSHPPTTPPAR